MAALEFQQQKYSIQSHIMQQANTVVTTREHNVQIFVLDNHKLCFKTQIFLSLK